PPVDARGPLGAPLGGVRALDALEQHRGRAVARAAFPDAPCGQRLARTGEKIAGAHPGGHEPRILARERDEESRRAPGIGLGERCLVAEAAHHLLLAGERSRLADAQQELRLDGEGFPPSPRRSSVRACAASPCQRRSRARVVASARRASRRARRRARQPRQPRTPALPAARSPTTVPPAANAPSSTPASGARNDRPGVSRTTVGSPFRNTT